MLSNKSLFDACSLGNIREVRRILDTETQTSLNAFRNGQTLLHVASQKGFVEIVEVLLEANAYKDARTKTTLRTPLLLACWEGHIDVVKLLLKAKVDIEAKDKDQRHPLHGACRNGHVEVVKLLLKANANIEAKTTVGCTALHMACQHNQVEVVKLLLESNVNINTKDEVLWTPLHLACDKGHVEVVVKLLEAGVDIEVKTNNQQTPLHRACGKGHVAVVKALLKANAEIEVLDKLQSTPLCVACCNGHVEVVKALLEATRERGQEMDLLAPLQGACENGHAGVVRELVGARVDLEAKFLLRKMTPLHIACQYGYINLVKVLVEAKANIEAMDKSSWTPLHIASGSGKVEIVKVLLKAKANIEAKNRKGRTPLWFACHKGHIELVEVLLGANNVDIEAKDQNGMKPGDEFDPKVDADVPRKEKIQQLLDEKKNQFDACREGRIRDVAKVVSSHPNFVHQKRDQLTPLHIACYYGQTEVIKILLRANASLDAKDSHGMKPGETFDESIWFFRRHVNSVTRMEVHRLLKEERDKRKEKEEEEKASLLKCQFGDVVMNFPCHKTTTFQEFIATVEAEWGEGKGIKYKDSYGDIVTMRRSTGELMSVRERNKTHPVKLTIFSLEPVVPVVPGGMPSSPPSPLPSSQRQKPFNQTKYHELLSSTKDPRYSFHIFSAVETLIEIYAQQRSISNEAVHRFIQGLHTETAVLAGVDELVGEKEVKNVAIRLWTSAQTFQDRELCSIFNEAIRDDNQAMMPSVVKFARGLNMLCVTRLSSSSLARQLPERTYRGGALPRKHHHFFKVGKQFRTPQFLSTSVKKKVASNFANKAERRGEEPVLWEFCFDEEFGCKHVNFIEKGNVDGEEEFLFTAFSVFTVHSSSEIKEKPMWRDPHRIVLEVAADNLDYPEDLPVSPWG